MSLKFPVSNDDVVIQCKPDNTWTKQALKDSGCLRYWNPLRGGLLERSKSVSVEININWPEDEYFNHSLFRKMFSWRKCSLKSLNTQILDKLKFVKNWYIWILIRKVKSENSAGGDEPTQNTNRDRGGYQETLIVQVRCHQQLGVFFHRFSWRQLTQGVLVSLLTQSHG